MKRTGKSLLVSLLLAFCLAAGAVDARAQEAAAEDLEAIRRTALDYIEGWYAGDAERMERSLHPDLAKRIVHTRNGESWLDHMGTEKLVTGTRAGIGKSTPAAEQRKDVKILDVFANAASVRVDARDWIDYMHMAKWNGRWVIVNVLWEMRPKP